MNIEVRKAQGEPVTRPDLKRAVARGMRQLTRVPRLVDRSSGVRSYQSHIKSDPWLPILFVVCFVLPTVAGALYYGLIASDRYVTTTQFVIRPSIGVADKPNQDTVGTNTGTPRDMIAQETLITLEYMLSRPMVEVLQAQLPLRQWYGRDSIDVLSRFDPDKPIEKFLRYWKRRVDLDVDPTSGVLTMSVEAFDPDESLALVKAMMSEAERMVNDLSRNAREDAVVNSARELKLAEERLAKINIIVNDFRNQTGVLDAKKSNENDLKILDQLKSQRANLAIQLLIGQRDLGPQSRQIIDLKQRIGDIDDNISRIQKQTASKDPEQRRRLPDVYTRLEDLTHQRHEAEVYYEEVRKANERARILAARQMMFFSPIIEPSRAQSSTEPRSILMISLITAGSAVLLLAAMLARRMLAN